MSITQALSNYRRVFLDTAPIIYLVEAHPIFSPVCISIFETILSGKCHAVTSPITLAECITQPIRLARHDLQAQYSHAITSGINTSFVPIGQAIAINAAQLRATYAISLSDALQIATALYAGCDGFVTNDIRLKRVQGISFLVISDFV